MYQLSFSDLAGYSDHGDRVADPSRTVNSLTAMDAYLHLFLTH